MKKYFLLVMGLLIFMSSANAAYNCYPDKSGNGKICVSDNPSESMPKAGAFPIKVESSESTKNSK